VSLSGFSLGLPQAMQRCLSRERSLGERSVCGRQHAAIMQCSARALVCACVSGWVHPAGACGAACLSRVSHECMTTRIRCVYRLQLYPADAPMALTVSVLV
jgi:hypothetical protein